MILLKAKCAGLGFKLQKGLQPKEVYETFV